MNPKGYLRVLLTAHISLLIRTAAVLHAAASAASPAVAAIVPFALAVAIRRVVVSHCEGPRLRERVLLCERKSIRSKRKCGELHGGHGNSRTFDLARQVLAS